MKKAVLTLFIVLHYIVIHSQTVKYYKQYDSVDTLVDFRNFDTINIKLDKFSYLTLKRPILFTDNKSYNELFMDSFEGHEFPKFTFIQEGIDFAGSRFDSIAIFNTIESNKENNFYSSTFKEESAFIWTNLGNVNFSEAKFEKTTSFEEATIVGECSFEKAFFSDISFKNAQLKSNVCDFSNTVFNGEVDFSNTYLPDTIVFTGAVFKQNIDLTNSIVNESDSLKRVCSVNLTDVDVSKVKLDYERFRLIFNEETSIEKKRYVYIQLLKFQKEYGFNSSYKKLDKEFRRFEAANGSLINRIFYNINRLWWGFGYEKSRILLWTFVLITVFSIINLFFLKHLIQNVYTLVNIQSKLININKRRGIIKTLKLTGLSFIYTSIIFFNIKIELDKMNFKNLYWVVYIYLIYVFGLICLAYMANMIILS